MSTALIVGILVFNALNLAILICVLKVQARIRSDQTVILAFCSNILKRVNPNWAARFTSTGGEGR